MLRARVPGGRALGGTTGEVAANVAMIVGGTHTDTRNTEAERRACEIGLRAERKAGEPFTRKGRNQTARRVSLLFAIVLAAASSDHAPARRHEISTPGTITARQPAALDSFSKASSGLSCPGRV